MDMMNLDSDSNETKKYDKTQKPIPPIEVIETKNPDGKAEIDKSIKEGRESVND